MAINMKRLTDKARAKVENEKKDEERKPLLAQGQGPRVSRQEAEQAWQRQKAEKATQEKTTTKTGQSPFRTREEALMALKKQKEQTQSQTTATKAVASAVKPVAATGSVKPTLEPVGTAAGKDAKAVTDWYTQNSEKAKEKAWKEQRSWEDQRSRIQPVMDAFAARDAGQTLTPEQQVTIDNYDYEEIKAGWDEANAEISRLQKVTGVESAMAQGYGSIKDERAERYKGAVSDAEANAAQMIGNGQMGEWSQMWQREMDAATSKRDELAADLDILKNTGADKDVIAEQEERLGWLNEDVQALTDVSVLAQPDFEQKSKTMEGVDDIVYQMVDGIAPPAWALQQGNGGYDAMADLWSRIQKMNDEERGIYKYIYASDPENGRQNAQDYLGRISNRLMYRNVQQRGEEMAELAEALPVTATIASTMYTPMEAAAGIGMGLAKLTGNDVNPYNPGFNAVRDKTTIRDTVTQKIGNPLGQFAYGVGTSMADVGVASVLGGGVPGVSSAMMALPAGAAKGMEMLEQGADSNTALLGGTAAAGTEWATEKLGFDRLYGSFTSGKMAGTYKDMLKAAVAGFFAEGSEEATSAGVNEYIDRWLMGDNSQRVQQIRQGMENGLSVDEAIREADWAFVKTLGENFLAGGVSGGLMQGGSYAAGMANANAATQQIVEELPEVNRELVQAAMEMEAGVRTMDEAVVEEAYAQIEVEQEKKVEQQNHAVFEAPAEVNGVQGAVSGVQKSGEGAQVLVKQDGKETAVPLSEVQFQNEEQRQAYGYATAYADDETARQFLAGYERTNAPIRNYARGFAAAYAAGRNSRQLMGAEKVWAKAVPEAIRQMAYEAGRKSAAAEDARLEMDADVDAAIARSVQKIPRMVTEEYTGAVNQVRRSKITKSQATQMAMLDSLGKKYGTQYIFVDSFQETQAANQHLGAAAASVQNGRINGVYKAGTNQMVIALDAEGGNLLRAAGHESWHYIKEHSQKNDYVRGDADALQGFALEKLQGVEDYDLETRIAQKQDQYKRMAGQELDRDAAVEEIVADSLVEVLATEQNVRDLMEQHATLGEKVMGFIKRFLGDIRATLRKLGGKNAEARAMLEQDEKTLQQIAEHFDRVMIEVNGVRGSMEPRAEAELKYAFMDNIGRSYEEQWREYKNGRSRRDRGLVLNAYEPAISDGAEYWTLPTRVITKGQRMDNQTSRSAHALSDQVFADMENDLNDSDFVVVDHTDGTVAALKNKGGQVIIYAGKHTEREGYSTIEATTVHERNDPRPMLRSKIESGNDIELYFRKKGKLHKMTGGTIPLYAVSTMERALNLSQESATVKNKFSLRDVDTTNATMEVLLEENKELRNLVRGLNAKLKEYNGRAVDEKTVKRIASGMKKQYASTVPLNTLTENLTRAFNAMQSAENTRQSEAAMEMMGNIALDMIQKSQIADREAYDASRDLRERFRKNRIGLTDTQWQEAESLYDTARDFRRAVFGKWNVPAQNGRGVTTLDMIWDDLVAEYPQYFSADASEGDMVQQVLAMLDATAIKYENPFGAEIEQVASGVATEIYQEYLGAGRETGSKNAAVDKLMDQLADAKKTILEQKRGLRRANRDIADMRAKREAQALRRKQNQDYNQVKNEIIRKKGQLLKKLEAPKNGAFIPASMHDAVHELLKAIDFEGKLGGETNKPLTREMLDRARDEYKKLNLPDENGGTGPLAAFYNGDLEHDFNLLAVEADGLRAKELSMKHMQSLRNIVAGYAAAIINEDRMFMQNRKESLQATGNDLLLSMSTRREHTVQGSVREWFSKGLQQGLLKPVTVFHQFKGTAMEPVWKALRNAEGKHIRHVEEGTAYLEEALTKYDQHESIREEGTKGKRDKAKEITFDNGTKMKLTDQEMMTLYATAKREQLVGTQHLMKGGFTLENAAKGSSLRPVILTAKDIQTITNSLTKQQREYVDHMVEYLSGTCADWGNEVTMELYGVEKFHEEYYIPFSVNKNYVKVEPATEQDSRIKTGSFTKALTVNASNPLEIKPFTEIWCQHVEKMSDYNAFVLPIEDMTRLMNYKGEGDGVKATMNRAYGKQTTDYIMHFLRRLNGNSRNEMGESWLGGFMGRAKGAAVTFNLSVAIQQAGSAPRAMAMIAPRHFMSGLAKAFAHGKVDNHRAIGAAYAELEKYAPIAVEKGWGYFDTNMSRGMYQRAQNTTMNKINDAGGKLAEWGDKITWAIIWEAVKSETADTYKEVMVGSEEYYQLCADRFQDVIDHTQVVDSIFQRAEFAAEKGMMKNFMAFMSEPLTTYNMMYRAIYDVSQAKDKAAKGKAMGRFGRTFTAFAVSSALTAAFKSVVMALRDRDNEKKDEEGNIIGVRDYWDKYLEALPGAVLDNLLGVGTVFTNAISDAMSGFGGGGDLTTGWIGNLGTGCKQMFDMLTGNRDSNLENWEKAMYKMLQGSSSVVGIGFGNLWRDVKSIGLTAFEIVERDSLAGTAWDKTVPFETRLAAAQKNYVYKKQGDNRKQNSGIYYDLMLTAYFEDGGMYENYEAAADAAIATGATYKNLVTAFKSRLRVAEDKIPQAAKALVDGNMETYQRCIEELQETGIGLRPISSMVLGEVRELLPQDEEGPGSGEDVVAEMQREDVDEDPVKYVQNYAYNRATTPQELKAAIDTMRKSGMNDDELRKKVTNSYRKTYCLAIWEGDAAAAKNAADMMKGAGVGIAEDDLVDWTSGLTGSYASETLHDMIKEGDGKTAVKIRAAMYKAHGQTKTNEAIESYVKRYCIGKENVDETNVKQALLAMGYSQQTIDSWFKK